MMKKIQVIFLSVAAVFSSQFLQAQVSPFVLSKTATDEGNGSYTLTLKSHMTGNYYDAESGAADIVFLLDVSKDLTGKVRDENLFVQVSKPVKANPAAITSTIKAAMTATTKNKATATAKNGTVVKRPMTKLDRTSKKTQNWTYKNVQANTTGTVTYYNYFYRDGNGDYYALRKYSGLPNTATGANNVYAIGYVDKDGNQWYLTTDGVSSTYKNTTSNTATLWNGELYTTGWTYRSHSTTTTNSDGSTSTSYQCHGFHYGNADATHEDQRYYLHTDGEYYPVRMRNDMPDASGGNNARVAYVIIDGVTWYLHGERLDTDYDHTMTTDYRAIYFKPLYYSSSNKGGWAYENIVAATSSGGHYYKYTDGKFYPVQKENLGSGRNDRYQAFIMVDGVKWYLYGTNRLSSTPCPFSQDDDIFFFFGELYTGAWTTNNITDGSTGTSHYYLHTDGEYYPVREIAATGNHQAYVMLPGGKYYFDGNGLADTPDTPYAFSTTKYVTLYFGSLYTVTGWSYAGVTAATAGSGHYYKHTNDYYYPVLKEDLTASVGEGEGRYQLYVEIPENGVTVKRYLWGHSLHADPCPYSFGTATVIWYGSLYKGGWSQNTITVNASDKQGYSYLHTDGEYYPIYRENVRVDASGNIVSSGGTMTYQNYVILPDGNHWYLCGNEVSRTPYKYSIKKNSNELGTVNNWFGPLYSGAWTSANTVAGTAENGHHYLHTDGKYYPVLKETLSNPTRYELYVNVPEGKRYLYGTGISGDPYPFSTRTNVAIYYGTLYTGGWTYNNVTNGSATAGQFYLYGDKYYKVVKEDRGSSYSASRYQVYIGQTLEGEDFPLGKTYLAGSDISSSPYPYTPNKASSLYFLPLYQLKANVKSVGLQTAVKSFIDEMASISQQSGINHRVALVQFGRTNWQYGNATSNLAKPHLKRVSSADANQYPVVLSDFNDLSNPAAVSNLQSDLAQPIETTGNSVSTTVHSYGFSLVEGLFRREGGSDEGNNAGYDYDSTNSRNDYEKSLLYSQGKVSEDNKAAYAARRKIVIVIGDGVERTWNSTNQGTALEWANRLKALTPLGDTSPSAPYDKVEIYYVQVNPGTSTSPAYADVTAFNKQLATDNDHFRHVEKYDEDLADALLDIAEEIGGEVIPVGSDAIVQDVVSREFTVPSGAQIQLFTADCTGDNEFTPESAWTPFSGTVVRTDNPDGTTTIRVTGFDFSANWCGVRGEGDDLYYDGKQLIVQIPVVMKDIVVGGTIPTNTPDSKLLDADEGELAVYPIPLIEGITIHLQISKSGLAPGESAIFTVWQKDPGPSAFVTTGNPVARVILTGNAEGTPVIADIVGLNPAKSYLIRDETNWSWTYTPDKVSISTEEQTLNPFVFINTPKTNILYDFGESEVRNVW